MRNACAAGAVLLAVSATLTAQAPSGRFTWERPIDAGRGSRTLPIDVALLADGRPFQVVRRDSRARAEGGLADLRLFDGSNRPVPFLLAHAPSPAPAWLSGRVLPVPATNERSGFEVDLGRPAGSIDAIRVEGIPAPFLKRLSVDGSGDRQRWTALAPEATLFDLPAEGLRQLDVPFAPGEYRYLRVIWSDISSGRVPLPSRVLARRVEGAPSPMPQRLAATVERQASEPGRSRYRLLLPARALPAVALELDIAPGHVFRPAMVTEARLSGADLVPSELGRATLTRIMRESIEAANLRLPITQPAGSELVLTIEDGDNPPLDLTGVSVELAELPAIYFEAPGGPLVARYGDRTLEMPEYDLQVLGTRLDPAGVPPASWGEPRRLAPVPSETAGGLTPEAGGALDAGSFQHVREIPATGFGLVALQLDAAALADSRGPDASFPDVRVLDESGRQLPYLLERREEPLVVELEAAAAESPVAARDAPPGRQQSIYRVALPRAGLPAATLVLDTSQRVFRRQVRLGIERPADRRHRDTWFEVLSSASWGHADAHTAPVPLALRLQTIDRTDILLVIDEGDNAPLPLSSVRLLLPSYRIRFFQPEGAMLRLAYGHPALQRPHYDLALLGQQVMSTPARVVELPAAAAERAGPGQPRLLSPLAFWILLGAAVLVVLGVIVRELRR